MVGLINNEPVPIPDYPDRDTARRGKAGRYQDADYPCRKCNDPLPVRYTATDDCLRCINTRPRGGN